MAKRGLIIGQGGLKPADKALLTPDNLRAGVTIDGVTGDSNVVDTSDATANTAQVLTGYSYYKNGEKKNGTMPNRGQDIIIPGTSNKVISTGYHNGTGYVQGDSSLVSANIKKGQTIFGVAGNSNVVDTSAGNIVASQLLAGVKAYSKGNLVTGTMNNYSGVSTNPGSTNYSKITAIGNSSTAGLGYITYDQSIAGYVDASTSLVQYIKNMRTENIKAGVQVGNDTVMMTGTFTSDATAAAHQIIQGKTAYVNGVKVTGTISTYSGTYTRDSYSVGSNYLDLSIPNDGYYTDAAKIRIADNDFVESNIKAGVNLFGKVGTLQEGATYASGVATSIHGLAEACSFTLPFAPKIMKLTLVLHGDHYPEVTHADAEFWDQVHTTYRVFHLGFPEALHDDYYTIGYESAGTVSSVTNRTTNTEPFEIHEYGYPGNSSIAITKSIQETTGARYCLNGNTVSISLALLDAVTSYGNHYRYIESASWEIWG